MANREWLCMKMDGPGGFMDVLNMKEAQGWELHSWHVNETDDGGPWIIAIWTRALTQPEATR